MDLLKKKYPNFNIEEYRYLKKNKNLSDIELLNIYDKIDNKKFSNIENMRVNNITSYFLKKITDKNKYTMEEIQNNLKNCLLGKKIIIIGCGPSADLYNEDEINFENTIVGCIKTSYKLCLKKMDIFFSDTRLYSGNRKNFKYYLEKFDYQYYFNHNPDLKKNGINTKYEAYHHWCRVGKEEKRICSDNMQIPMTVFFSDHYIDNDIASYYSWLKHTEYYGDLKKFSYNYDLIFSPEKINCEYIVKYPCPAKRDIGPKIYLDNEYNLIKYHKNNIFYGDFNNLVDNFLKILQLVNYMGIYEIKTYGMDHLSYDSFKYPHNTENHNFEMDFNKYNRIWSDDIMTYYYLNSNYKLFRRNNIIVKSDKSQVFGILKKTEDNITQTIDNNLRLKIESLISDKELEKKGFTKYITEIDINYKFLIKLLVVIKNHKEKNIYDCLYDCDFKNKSDWILNNDNIKYVISKYLWF